MGHHPLALRASELWARVDPSLAFVPQCDRTALKGLRNAFASACPLTVLTGAGKLGTNRVITSFLEEIEVDADVVRIPKPCLDATECMRDVVRALGFDTKDLILRDLESIFRMFLSFQKTHRRRTVLCIEETEVIDRWVLDKVRSLVQLEMQRNFGLAIILAGRQNINALLHEQPLKSVFAQAGRRVEVAPFELDETRAFVRQRSESDGIDDISQILAFEAVDLIHELSGGVQDTVTCLCRESFQLAHEQGTVPVTTDIIERAAESLQEMSGQTSNGKLVPAEIDRARSSKGRLIARIDGEVIDEREIDKDRILIGRDRQCDICIVSPVVSRQHACVESTPAGLYFVDLGSTNGSFVGGAPIDRVMLEENEVIVVGDCRIEFVPADYGHDWIGDMELRDGIEARTVAGAV